MIKKLDDPKTLVRQEAYEDLLYFDERAIPKLIKALKNKNRRIRCYAAGLLGELGGEHVIQSLTPILNDKDKRTREVASESIESIKKTLKLKDQHTIKVSLQKKDMQQTESRKKDHVELVIAKGAQYAKTSGFERVDFIHNALPEISLSSVDLSTKFLGKSIRYPLLITGMTGGYSDAEKINRGLAAAAQKHSIAFGVGSQRAMIEKPELAKTYKVRDVAPDIPLLANIGGFQLKKYSFGQIDSLVQTIEADALAVHLNPLQEVIQPEGDTDFTGVLGAISATCDKLSVPVLVKETGAGISQETAIKLKEAGAKWLDVSGAGGTSWSKVEYLRYLKNAGVHGFEDWGIPTVEAIIQCRGVLPLIASGGVRSGIDGAKAIALGADLCGAAYPFIKALRAKSLEQSLGVFEKQMQICAYLTGSKTIEELKKAKMRIN